MRDEIQDLQARLEDYHRQLATHAERFRSIVDNNADGIVIVDEKGSVCFVNPAAERLFERGTGDLVGHEFGFPVAAGEPAEIDVLQRGGRIVSVEMRVAQTVWDGAPARLAALRDITERKRMEAALRAANERLRALIHASPMAILVPDAAQRITIWNPAAEKMFGASEADVQGRPLAEVLTGAAEQLQALWRRVEAGETVSNVEMSCRTRAGSWIQLNVSLAPLKTAADAFDGAIAVIDDVTERKELEERIRRSQRLEMAGRVASQVAHDFNNLLQPLVGYPALIKRRLPEGHPAVEYCDTMVRLGQQLAKINDDLLTLGRRGHVERQPIELNRIVEPAIAEFQRRHADDRIEVRLADQLPPINGAEAQLLRVISNLVANALDATAEGGTVAVSTERITVDEPDGQFSPVPPGEYVRLRVADTGHGIPPEIRDQIFDAFFTTKHADHQRGSGLGLTVVQAVVEDHEAILDFQSAPGVGTTFDVYFPVVPEVPAEPVTAGFPGGTETILVVDDEEVQRTLMQRLLEALGYRARVFADGEHAVEFLREHSADLLIVDMVMPNQIDGAETLRRALEVRPDLAAIVLSGFSETRRAKTALQLGAGAFLQKPLTLERLATAVRAELDRRTAATAAPGELGA